MRGLIRTPMHSDVVHIYVRLQSPSGEGLNAYFICIIMLLRRLVCGGAGIKSDEGGSCTSAACRAERYVKQGTCTKPPLTAMLLNIACK